MSRVTAEPNIAAMTDIQPVWYSRGVSENPGESVRTDGVKFTPSRKGELSVTDIRRTTRPQPTTTFDFVELLPEPVLEGASPSGMVATTATEPSDTLLDESGVCVENGFAQLTDALMLSGSRSFSGVVNVSALGATEPSFPSLDLRGVCTKVIAALFTGPVFHRESPNYCWKGV